jgi:hypothetical protein
MKVHERLHGKEDERRTVALRCSNPSVNLVSTKSGAQIAKGDDGLFRMEWRDAQWLVRTVGWSLIEEP